MWDNTIEYVGLDKQRFWKPFRLELEETLKQMSCAWQLANVQEQPAN